MTFPMMEMMRQNKGGLKPRQLKCDTCKNLPEIQKKQQSIEGKNEWVWKYQKKVEMEKAKKKKKAKDLNRKSWVL